MKKSPLVAGGKKIIDMLDYMFEHVLTLFAAIIMFSMVLLTFFDVAGRSLFHAPIPGGFEITELLLASIVFLGLPIVTARNEHVEVDMLDSVMPRWLKSIQNITILLLSTLAFCVLTFVLWQLAIRTYQYQDTTAILEIPFTWLVVLMALTTSFAAFTLVCKTVAVCTNAIYKN